MSDGCPSFPLSFAQERLWFLDQLEPGSPFYSVPASSRLRGRIDTAALRWSLGEIVRRHESLRTTFATGPGGEPVQVIHPARVTDLVELPVVDRSHVPPGQREADAGRIALEELQKPFDLGTGPLLRCTLVRLAEDDHLLVVILHHIVADAWSLGVFFRELSELYQARCRGRAPSLPDLPIQYADFAQWQRQWLQGPALDAFVSYWRTRLAGAPAVIDLPADRPRPAVQTFHGALEPFEIPRPLHAGLAALGQARGASIFMTVLAVFLELLHRCSGQEDLVVGSPIANRNRAEIEDLIGFFVNTLVLRTDLSGDPGFLDLLERVSEGTLGGYDHQDLPFAKLVEELRPERSLSHNPLFQVMFSLQNAPTVNADLDGAAGSDWVDAGTGTSKFDLALLTTDSGGALRGALEYNTDLFDRATAARMLGHFRTLLEEVVRNPRRSLSDLPLLAAAERDQLLAACQAPRADFPRDACLQDLWAAQTQITPDAVAAVFEGEALTYRELDLRAGRLARRLRSLGAGPSVCVGICAERSLDLVVAFLGVLKAGAAYLPLDPAYPEERLAFMLADAAAPVLLTQRRLAGRLPATGARVLHLDDLEETEVEERGRRATPDDLAYVIYTSGSTGRPKGVAMPHRPLVNLVAWQIGLSALPPGARTLQFTSLSFDVSCQEIFSTWGAGGTLVVLPEEGRRDVNRLLRCLAEERIERLFLPPVALQQLAAASSRPPLPDLREVIAAGEQLTITPALRDFFGDLPGCRLSNQYGPSETHITTGYILEGPPSEWPMLPPIGRPIPNTWAYLLDRSLQPVPAGVPGEVYLGGACLARGYLDRPDLTAERFVPDDFTGQPGERLYRSGDLGRLRPDDEIEYLGRIDHQVKIRGFRVEPAEVEAALERHPGVRRAVVVAREDTPGDRRLVAYLLTDLTDGPAPSASQLRSALRERLPEHLVPSAFVGLERLPLTPSGKVDRRALPAPGQDRPDLERDFVPPRTPLEEDLAAIWRQVLKLERIGVHDSFFDLGGHSLLATQVLSRVRDAFGIEVPVRRIFEAPTIAELVVTLVSDRADGEESDELARLLAELEDLPEDQVQAQLSGM